MADIKDRVEKGLSEVRTTILGVQIFVGFQYQAIFQNGFAALPPVSHSLFLLSFLLLLCCIGALIAPVSIHQLAERGQASPLQDIFARRAMSLALAALAAAIGFNLVIALRATWGLGLSIGMAVLASATAVSLWFGMEMNMKRPSPPQDRHIVPLDLKTRVSQMLTETRIVFPGVQALLGFQYAAYLTDVFKALPQSAQAVHTVSLVLLLASMIALMAPAPFHRIAENGEDTERACVVGVRFTLAGLALLGMGLAGDFYVAMMVITKNPPLAASTAIVCGVLLLATWFALPWARREKQLRSSRRRS